MRHGAPDLTELQHILEVVAAEGRVSVEELISNARSRSITHVRHAGMWLAKVRPTSTGIKRSYSEVGRAFGGRDHTTAIAAVEKIERERERDVQLRVFLSRCEARLDEPVRSLT